MSKTEKVFEKLMAGQNDANFPFEDLCTLLTKLGYTARKTKGSHIIFQHGPSFLNLQPSTGGKAKEPKSRAIKPPSAASSIKKMISYRPCRSTRR